MSETATAPKVPAHVPPEMVSDFNFYTSPQMVPTPFGDPHEAVAHLATGPRIFYSPETTRNGDGAWVITRASDQREVLQDGATFSSYRRIFSAAVGEDWPVIPLELDPPDHGRYRSLLNPLLSPKRMMAMEPFVRFLKRFRGHFATVERVVGALLVLTGVAFFTGGMQSASNWLLNTFPGLANLG